ncbi:MAG: hypothetical protein MI755_13300 [Sphingomonadales bacterium]|nr:hypothetical protein [Sphingomonadales bacterium]
MAKQSGLNIVDIRGEPLSPVDNPVTPQPGITFTWVDCGTKQRMQATVPDDQPFSFNHWDGEKCVKRTYTPS